MGRSKIAVKCSVCGKVRLMDLGTYNYRVHRNTEYRPVCSDRCKGIMRSDLKLGRLKSNGARDVHMVL